MTVNVGENLRLIIEAAHVTPRQVALYIGRSPSTLSRWFALPEPRISESDLEGIAAFLRIAPDEFRKRLRAQKGEEGMLREGNVSFGTTDTYREDLAVERLDSYARRLRDLATEYQGRMNEIMRMAELEVERAKATIQEMKPARSPRKRRRK